MNDAVRYLLALAQRHAGVYSALPQTQAVIVMGSVAEGECDLFSDLDMAVYYDALPSDNDLEAARLRNQGGPSRLLGGRGDDGFAESYAVHGVECQIVHCTVAAWERQMATVLEELDVTSPLQKALSGLLKAKPLYGEALIRRWQAGIAAYPDALARAMVERYLTFFPIWGLQDRFAVRDATLWQSQTLIEAEQNILGVLAGVNRLYYSTFQFKRLRRFVAQMTIAPPNLADRLDALLRAEPASAIAHLEELVDETVALVETYMPGIDTSAVRQRLGWRQQPWAPLPP